jgi:histone H3/H4
MNIGGIMRSNTKYNVSPKAVSELISYLEAHLQKTMVRLEEIAKKNKRKTIFPEDVVEIFSFRDNGIIPDE